MRDPLTLDQGDNYERPNQKWVCGLSEVGPPCPLGPLVNGRCSRSAACHPIKNGDRWLCNRSELRGGECPEGPSPEGKCCHHYECIPVRSLRARRGRFVIGCVVATVGALCLLLSGNWRNEFLAPGKLSVHHAQLLARGDEKTNRCASCHAAGNQSMGDWLAHAFDPTLATPTQSMLCLECHKKDFAVETALWAHNVDPQVLLAISEPGRPDPDGLDRSSPPAAGKDFEGELTRVENSITSLFSSHRRDPTAKIACSGCHQEHLGPEHNLTAISDRACQTCHREQYQSFATDHPEFDNWPEKRRTRIAFDHAAHENKHFPEEKHAFACRDCHRQGTGGEFQKTLDYESTCAQCHDSKIQTSWATGVPVISLPMLDLEALSAVGHTVGTWPLQATGDFDGPLPLFTKLLLLVDEQAAKAINTLGADFDFYDIDPDNAKQLEAAANIIKATKQLIADLETDGQATIGNRLGLFRGRPLTTDELSKFTARLSPASIEIIARDWLTNENTDAAASDRNDAERVVAGGWYTDPVSLSLRYRPTGHADALLTSWIDILAEASGGRHKLAAEKLLSEAMKPTAAGMCGSCHSIDRLGSGQLQVNWLAKQSTSQGAEFTFFSHAPHVLQAELADCTACHRMDQSPEVMNTYTQNDPYLFTPEFHQLTRQDCSECHTSGAAGDNCTQCHRYHAGGIAEFQ